MAVQYLQQCEGLTYQVGSIQCLIIIANNYLQIKDYAKGLVAIQKALDYQYRQLDDKNLPIILHIHAQLNWGLSQYYSALKYWLKALEQACLIDDVKIQIHSLIGIGNVCCINKDYQQAVTTHSIAVKIATRHQLVMLEVQTRVLLAQDYYKLKQYLDMLSTLDITLELQTDNYDSNDLAKIWQLRSLSLLSLDKISDCQHSIMKSCYYANEQQQAIILIELSIYQAEIAIKQQQLYKASMALGRAKSQAKKLNQEKLLSKIYLLQSNIYEQLHKFELALKTYKKYRHLTIERLQNLTLQKGLDTNRRNKELLEYRVKRVVSRLQQSYLSDKPLQQSNLMSESHWWEQVMLAKSAQHLTKHSIVVVHHSHAAHLTVCLDLLQTYSNQNDCIARLSQTKLGLLINADKSTAKQLYAVIQHALQHYPWQHQGLSLSAPQSHHYSIFSFPFTMELLELDQREAESAI